MVNYYDNNIHRLARRALYQRLRGHFPSFIARVFNSVDPSTEFLPNWHIDAIAEYLEATRRSEITRLIINMPPRALKSICVSVAWPAWLLGHEPSMRIMAASYSQALSLKHSLDTRLVIEEPWYKRIFPHTRIIAGQNEKHKFVTSQRGFRFATSVGGTATGEGGDVLIVDDPLSPIQAASAVERERANMWFDQTFSSRLNDKAKGRIVIVMQRLHSDDLSGHLLSKSGHNWEHLCLPAICEKPTVISIGNFEFVRDVGHLLHASREDESLIERARNELGSFAFAAQYQQVPLIESGGMIEPSWFVRYDSLPPMDMLDRVVQSWDTAIKSGSHNDATVCMTFGECDGLHYIIDVVTMRVEYPELKREVLRLANKYEPDAILIEDKASGQSLIQDLRRETSLPVIARLPKRDKLTRLAAVSPMVESGRVAVPRYAQWLAEFESELFAFPNAPHDDIVDAFSQYLNWVRDRAANSVQPRIRRL